MGVMEENKNFNPFYDSDFCISHEDSDDRRLLVELPEDELLRLKNEIDVVLGMYAKNKGVMLAVDSPLEPSSGVVNNKKETLVINMFAGPGAGKTTCAWEIASKLKKLGYVTEYVGEYAKELVWDGRVDLLEGTAVKQKAVYDEQKRRIDRLLGKVDFVVTDSPPILSMVYLKESAPDFEKQMVEDFHKYHTFNIFIERSVHYEKEGRLQTLEEAKALDMGVKSFLKEHNIYYGTYRHHTVDISIENMQTTFKKLNSKEKASLKDSIEAAENLKVKNTDLKNRDNDKALELR